MRRIVSLLLVAMLALTSACSSTTTSGPVTINVTIANGKVTPPATTYSVSPGATVTINVTSDADEMVPVHGHGVENKIVAGTKMVITFVADKTGQYEVETHVVEATTIATLNVR
ncbi:MAG: cupredoxin domain-containing protein [Propionibacteriaceae bacterium]